LYCDGEKLKAGYLSRCREEFVTFNAGGHSSRLLMRLDPDNAAEAMNLDVARHGDLFGQREDEFDRASGLKLLVGPKIQTPEADVAGFSLFFQGTWRFMETQGERKHHGEAP